MAFLEPGARSTPRTDNVPAEYPAPVLPGAVGLGVGTLGLIGTAFSFAWAGMLPGAVLRALSLSSLAGDGLGPGQTAVLVLSLLLALFGLAGLTRGRAGRAWVLTLCGKYRGTVRHTGLVWVSPLVMRRKADVRLRHWRSEPMPAVDVQGLAVEVSILVVWRIKDTARALLGVEDHERYLRESVEAAVARVFPHLPTDTGRDAPGAYVNGPSLRDAETVGEELTRLVADDGRPAGLEVFSVQAVSLDYAPEVAAAVHRHRAFVWDVQHRDALIGSVLDSVEDTVNRLTSRGLVELDEYERKSLVRDLTVAFCSARVADNAPVEA
ncbi:SPFH domain-containing protein [Streptomyces sp. NA04227]|nr:SPFH domain-containing protein [Streptomyces sp. NA04227]